jgi:SAM-dependent methyltransferase
MCGLINTAANQIKLRQISNCRHDNRLIVNVTRDLLRAMTISGGDDMSRVAEIREKLGQVHIDTPYYAGVDNPDHLGIFWSKNSLFKRMFDQLDLTNAVELACGHGRHTAQILDRVGRITLIDINQENIDVCRKRFFRSSNVFYSVNNGADLREIKTGTITALFCYDAMVHFEASDVIGYLNEIARILRPGGRALLHYSNCEDFPEGTYEDQQHWRSFFSEKMMRHFSNRAGFRSIDTQITPWPPTAVTQPRIDAVTLLEKLQI